MIHSHIHTLHGGVGLTMANVIERYWVPRLKSMIKRVIKRCYGCKRFQASAFIDPPPGNLPQDRIQGSSLFQVVGVDYAGPIKYRVSKNREGKAYFVLYACSLTRALYLELKPWRQKSSLAPSSVSSPEKAVLRKSILTTAKHLWEQQNGRVML